MDEQGKKIEVALETLLDSVDLAETVVVGIAESSGFPEEECHKIGMAVRESVINAYNYGNQRERAKKILLTVELFPKKMVVRVLDQGTGFDAQAIPDCLAEENLLRTSGRGLFLIRAFMDDFEVQRGTAGGAELVMTKFFPAPGSSNGGSPARAPEEN
ncbi:MAG: ATP-binding protein [Candidatus Acidiferrales bacterium]